MNWKERSGPDNESEAGCYRYVFAVALLGFFGLLLPITDSLNSQSKIALGIIVFAATTVAISLPMARKLQVSFPISRSQSVWVSLVSVVIILVLFVLLIIGLGMLTNVLETFLPIWLVAIIVFGAYFVLSFRFTEATRILQNVLLKNLLDISTEGAEDTYNEELE